MDGGKALDRELDFPRNKAAGLKKPGVLPIEKPGRCRTSMSDQEQIFIGRQPIMDRNQRVAAYELLFRASATAQSAQITDFSRASARVIVDTFGTMGADAVIGSHLAFLNLTYDMLMSDTLEALPRDRVVLEVLETVDPTPDVRARCEHLHKEGFILALDDWVEDDPREPLIDLAKYIKVDLPAIPEKSLPWLVRKLKRHSVVLLAEKVEEPEEFERCREIGFDLFQGYYFARPAIVSAKRIDPARVILLKLLQQMGRDADIGEVGETFKQNPNLGVSLLRLVNSAAMARPCKIANVEQALVFLGKRQVTRWLNLLLFVGDDGRGYSNPLMQTAAMRGRLMELLVHAKNEDYRAPKENDGAFLTGMLSLVDALLGIEKEELVEELNLDEEVRDALLEHKGDLGELLALTERLEENDFSGVNEILFRQGLSSKLLTDAQIEAFGWVNGLSREGS